MSLGSRNTAKSDNFYTAFTILHIGLYTKQVR